MKRKSVRATLLCRVVLVSPAATAATAAYEHRLDTASAQVLLETNGVVTGR